MFFVGEFKWLANLLHPVYEISFFYLIGFWRPFFSYEFFLDVQRWCISKHRVNLLFIPLTAFIPERRIEVGLLNSYASIILEMINASVHLIPEVGDLLP